MDYKEKEIVEDLACVWNQFVKLDPVHPMEREEFAHAIHAAKVIIMARETQRELNELNKKKDAPKG